MAAEPMQAIPTQACVHFLKGKCLYGDLCQQPHVRPPCAFGTACLRADCFYAHPTERPSAEGLVCRYGVKCTRPERIGTTLRWR